MYILAILFLGNMHILCGVAIYLAMFLANLLESAVAIAQKDTKIRITDYQMYISGERLEEYQKIISWFTTPITTIVSLIIPLLFYRVGFTSDWDVLYMGDVRVKCMLIGLGFDLVGFILMTIPYLFMWDFTDEKHAHIMEVLKQRAEEGNKKVEGNEIPVTVEQRTNS